MGKIKKIGNVLDITKMLDESSPFFNFISSMNDILQDRNISKYKISNVMIPIADGLSRSSYIQRVDGQIDREENNLLIELIHILTDAADYGISDFEVFTSCLHDIVVNGKVNLQELRDCINDEPEDPDWWGDDEVEDDN